MKVIRYLNLFIFLLPYGLAYTQPFQHWRFWDASDGLGESYSRSITVNPQGNIILNHGDIQTLSIFDGYTIRTLNAPTPFVPIYQGFSDLYWTINGNGMVCYKNGKWLEHEIDEIKNERLINFLLVSQKERDRILLLFFDRILEYQPDEKKTRLTKHVNDTGLQRFYNFKLGHDNGVWVCGEQGLAKVEWANNSNDEKIEWTEYLFDKEIGLRRLMYVNEGPQGEILGGAFQRKDQQQVLIKLQDNNWSIVGTEDPITEAWPGLNNAYWMRNSEILNYVANGKSYTIEHKEVIPQTIADVKPEANGNFWVISFQGVMRYAYPTWQTPTYFKEENPLVIHSILEDSKGRLWFDGIDTLVLFDQGEWKRFPFPEDSSTSGFFTKSLSELPDGRIAIHILNLPSFLLVFNPELEEFEMVLYATVYSTGSWTISTIFPKKDGSIFVQSFVSRDVSKEADDENARTLKLEVFDGNSFNPYLVLENQWTLGGLRDICETADGALWLGGTSGDGIGVYENGEFKTFGPEEGYTDGGAFCILEVEPGVIWVGGRSKIFQYDGEEWTELLSGIDSARSMIKSKDGSVWLAAGSGVYRYFENSWVENTDEEGLPSSVAYEIFEDTKGRLWAGTQRGLSLYHPKADPDAPRLIFKPEENTASVAPNEPARFVFSGIDKWKYTPQDRLVYSHRLDNSRWSPFSPDIIISYEDLEPGDYQLHVRVMDRNWNISEPFTKGFEVLLNWYEQPGFIIITALSSILIVFFAGYALNRHINLRLSYQALRQTQQQLIQSEKMASLGQLVAGVAHEINNPVNFIKSNIQPLQDYLNGFKNAVAYIYQHKNELPSELKREFEELHEKEELDYADQDSEKLIQSFIDGADRIAKIVSDLRLYSRGDEDYYSAFDIHEAIDSTLTLLHYRIKNNIQIHKQYESLPMIECSPGKINQVIMNLLSNAIDAIEGKGTIWIRTFKKDDHIQVQIEDDGKGIPKKLQTRVFDPFFTSKPVGAGTGLGLSITYGIIEQHKGAISLESVEGKGSTFTITLPIAGR